MGASREKVESPRRVEKTRTRVQEPERVSGRDVGEATTKQNTMNVPMCKLQAQQCQEDRWLVFVAFAVARELPG